MFYSGWLYGLEFALFRIILQTHATTEVVEMQRLKVLRFPATWSPFRLQITSYSLGRLIHSLILPCQRDFSLTSQRSIFITFWILIVLIVNRWNWTNILREKTNQRAVSSPNVWDLFKKSWLWNEPPVEHFVHKIIIVRVNEGRTSAHSSP